MWEIRTLRAMWRGLEPTHGLVSEALPKETRETDRPNYGNAAPVLDPTQLWADGYQLHAASDPRKCGLGRSRALPHRHPAQHKLHAALRLPIDSFQMSSSGVQIVVLV